VTVISPGSTLHIQCPPTLAYDPGSKWTAGLLRVGADALDGFTLALGLPDSPDLINAHEAVRVYTDRIIEHGLAAWDKHFRGQQIRVAVEVTDRPTGGRGRGKVALHQWVLASRVAAAITGAFPGCVLVPPAKCGHRHLVANGGTGRIGDYYPPQLIGSHPLDWGPIESHRKRRDHEWAAYVIAAEAELLNGGRHA
jgi:hypothetical protein